MSASLRVECANYAGRIAGFLSRKLGHGRGEAIHGQVLLKFAPQALTELAAGRDVVLVTGTNGKTSTTRFLTAIMQEGTGEQVSTSEHGANMQSGIAVALATKPQNRYVVLECDELYIPQMYALLKPKVIVLLNLSRDQLHRTGEVRKIARLWNQTFTQDDVTLVINRDDPFLEYAASNAGHVVRVTFGGRKHPDAATCPQCDALLDWSVGDYRCECGLGSTLAQVRADQRLRGPSRNAVLAIEAARLMGAVVPIDVLDSLIDQAPDRVSVFTAGGKAVPTHLAKNPESWREALNRIQSPEVILSVNARGMDGRDTSWLWDVDYRPLINCRVVCTGERRRDTAYRLSVQGIDVRVADDFSSAVECCQGDDIQAIASYTAFQDLDARERGFHRAVTGQDT